MTTTTSPAAPAPQRNETLHSFTTDALLAEIKRRSLGCMLVIVRAEESGDTWRYALKGSPILLGAMSAALTIETRRHLENAP